MTTNQFPYRLTRVGTIMTPDPDDPMEAEGVLNPAAALDPGGVPLLFPRLVSAGNWSRIGRAEILLEDGVPAGVRRLGVVLAPDRAWEHGARHGGVEDPRITWIAALGRYVMAYVAYGPLGPRPALAVSSDAVAWERLGPVQFRYEDALNTDLNLFANKDLAWFPEVVPGPDGRPSYAFLHRPMFELDLPEPDNRVDLPAGIDDPRAAMWISYVDAEEAGDDLSALCRPHGHSQLAGPQAEWEELKIGGGAPPIRVPEGWLLLYHGVSGSIDDQPFRPQKNVCYQAGAMILAADDPQRVIARSAAPLLAPELELERVGTVGNVVFPTATVEIDGVVYVLYGMADAAIGVARLDPVREPARP